MQSAAAACSGQKQQWSSLLEEEVARHLVMVRPCHHSVDFLMLSGNKALFKLSHGHYKKRCLLVAVAALCRGNLRKDPHQKGVLAALSAFPSRISTS